MTKNTRELRVTTFGARPDLVETAPRVPDEGQIAVEVHACALNFSDLLMIEGTYQETPKPPFTLGMEWAGVVTALGVGVTGFAVGDRVAAFTGQGGLATTTLCRATDAIKLPDALSLEAAAALPVAYGTSHLALRKAALSAGERLVVTGAAGGVGLTAVEIGKSMGADVIAIARGADKLAVAEAAGADHLIDADDPDLRLRLKDLGGADVVYDAVGGTLFAPCLSGTKPGGRYLAIGFAGGVPEVKANHLLVKNISLIGFYWGAYRQLDPVAFHGSLVQIMTWAAEGRIRPHVSHRYGLDDWEEALACLRERRSTGKIVVLP